MINICLFTSKQTELTILGKLRIDLGIFVIEGFNIFFFLSLLPLKQKPLDARVEYRL